MKKVLCAFTTLTVFCVWSFNSAFAQFQYVFPKDGATRMPLNPTINLRHGDFMDPNSLSSDLVTITGSKSGVIPATIILSTDGQTICISPAVPFAEQEEVIVEVKDGLKTMAGLTLAGETINFSTRRNLTEQEQEILKEYLSTHHSDGSLIQDPNQQSTYYAPPADAGLRSNPFDFVNVYVNNNPYPWEIFFHRNSAIQPEGYGVMTNSADSIFYRASNTDGSNFHVNKNGQLTAYRLNWDIDTAVIVMDTGYNIVDIVHCGNGLAMTQHEHLFMPDGSKWFTIYDWQGGWDLSQYGGSSSAIVAESWIQKLDAANNPVWQWGANHDGEFQILDAATDIMLGIGAPTFDPWHINAMYMDWDGNLIAAFRNMDLIVKINPSNSNIIWYWGPNNGNNPSFFPLITFQNDPDGGFSHSHHVQRLPNGNILMFDNGNLHQPPISKPKEYILNETNYTANCVWYYQHPQVNGFNLFTKQQGSVQRMPNGNTFIGYGLPSVQGLPNGTEIDANKNIVWEFRFTDSTEYSYRLYKFAWPLNVGIAGISKVENINVFPNPGSGLFNLDIDVPAGKVTIHVLNVLGQTIYSKSENPKSGKLNTTIDLTGHEKGVYFLQISAGVKKMAGKIVVE